MFEFISELPKEVIIFLIILTIGIIASIVKRTLKFFLMVLSIIVLLFVLYKLGSGFLQL